LSLIFLMGLTRTRGFSIGITDVTPGEGLLASKAELIKNGYATCYDYIAEFESGKLEAAPGCTGEL
jgi:DNA-directed RNA polymerase III subunit RPC1